MSKIFNPDSAGKEKTYLAKVIVAALRELNRQADTGQQTKDQVAFIALALTSIQKTIEVSVSAWEKRGYWVKADKYRMEWEWTGQIGEKIRIAILNDDWQTIAMLLGKIGQKLSKIIIPEKHRLGTPWIGAWDELARRNK